MNISVFGLGYVGLSSIACLIEQEHNVIGVDIIQDKIDRIKNGDCPIHEPGVLERLKLGLDSNRLIVTADVNDAIRNSEIAFVCVGTPSSVSGAHDLGPLINVSKQIAKGLSNRQSVKERILVVYRSTVPPGTMEDLVSPLFERATKSRAGELWEVLYHPEFLREASAIFDYYNPPKIVIGKRNSEVNISHIFELYKHMDKEIFEVGFKEAEITKFLDNSFHALKVSFANEIGRICDSLKISCKEVIDIFLSDTKLNISESYLRPGAAFGGSCLPKDVRALQYIARNRGLVTEIVDNILRSNESHKKYLLKRVINEIEQNESTLVIGLSFKKDTDDLRESPHLDLIQSLIGRGYNIKVYDPNVNFEDIFGKNLAFSASKIPHLAKIIIGEEELRELGKVDAIVYAKDIDISNLIKAKKIVRLDLL